GGAFGLGLIETLVIGERMRVRARGAGAHQNRRLIPAAMFDRRRHGGVRRQEVGAVALENLQVGESGDQLGDIAAGSLLFDGQRWPSRYPPPGTTAPSFPG